MERIRLKPQKTNLAAKSAPHNQTGDMAMRPGYKNPPVATRFKPGISGNPGGRPKGVRSLKDDFREALNQTITVDNKKITQQRAIVDRLVADAAGGDTRTAISTISLILELFGAESEYDFQASADASAELGAKLSALREILAALLKDHKQDANMASLAELVAFLMPFRQKPSGEDSSG